MTPGLRHTVIAAVACAAVTIMYVSALDVSPVYLLNDEIFGALQAISLASTGRSLSGEWFPVFFRGLEFPPGRDPLFVYATAAAFKLAGISEVSLRVPTALVGITCIVLSYVLGRRIWGRATYGLLAAIVLALTPAFFINSRIGIPTLWSVPWILGWLLALAIYVEQRQPRALFAAALCLGISVYGYLGSALVVPLYVVATIAVIALTDNRERFAGACGAAALGFMLPLTLLAYWQLIHPERWREIASYYANNARDVSGITPLLRPSGWPNYAGVQERVTSYWNHFDPALLFLGGDKNPRYSTDRSGLFLLSAVVLLPLGVYHAARESLMGRLLVFCFFATPMVAALGGDVQIQRVLPFVVFGSLLSTWGAVWLLAHPEQRYRRAIAVLLVIGVAQFTFFLRDYYGHYRWRSGESRGGNLRGAIAEVMNANTSNPGAAVYLSSSIPNADVYWKFYEAARGINGRTTTILTAKELADRETTSPAFFIAGIDDVPKMGRPLPPPWRLRTYIYEIDGPSFYVVYQRE